MKKKFLFFVSIFCVSLIFSQTESMINDSLTNQIKSLKKKTEINLFLLEEQKEKMTESNNDLIKYRNQTQREINSLNELYSQSFEKLKAKIEQDSISFGNLLYTSKKDTYNDLIKYRNQTQIEIDSLNELYSQSFEKLKAKIKQDSISFGNSLSSLKKDTDQELNNISIQIDKKVIYFIISILLIISFIISVFLILRKRIFKQSSNTFDAISKAQKQMEEESLKLDNKLIDLLEKQTQLETEKISSKNEVAEIDHSLALKVADEIIRIEKNLSRMDEKVKGHKQLKASVRRIKNNFSAKGYEIVDMIGMKYDTGMKVTANFVPDKNLEKDEQIISRIIKPQINFNDKMIQSAQIEVSLGG